MVSVVRDGAPGRSKATGSALEKTLRVMEALSAPGGPRRLVDLAAGSGLPRSTACRILTSLVEQGYAVTDGEGTYGIGLRLRTMAADIGAEASEGIVELLEFLRRGTGQTVHLALRGGDGLTCVRKIDSAQSFRTSSRVGSRFAMHSTALGKAVLAHLPPEEVDAVVRAGGLPPLTARTLTDRERLAADLARVRERGYAIDDEENEPSVRCLGAPVFDRDGTPVGGVSLTAAGRTSTREELERFAPPLLQAARSVEGLLRRG